MPSEADNVRRIDVGDGIYVRVPAAPTTGEAAEPGAEPSAVDEAAEQDPRER
jgi:hypothetical protein